MARFYEGIGFKLFASLLTIALVLLVVGGFAFYNQSETILEDQILASLSNTATLQKIRVNDAVESEITELESFTQRPLLLSYIQNYLRGDDTAQANITISLETTLNATHYEAIYLLSSNGRVFFKVGVGGFPST